MANRTWDAWNYRESAEVSSRGKDLTGFSVEAVDGSIGKIDRATLDVGSSYVVVDTGPWIFGQKVMLPAGTIDRVDQDEQKVYVTGPRTRSRTPRSSTTRPGRRRGYRETGHYYYGTYDRGAF